MERSIATGRYVIMPDHLHLFVCGPDDFRLGRWIGMLKQLLSKQSNRSQYGNAVFSIICCEAKKAMARNGITFVRIPFGQDWWERLRIGLTPVRL